MEGGAIQTMPQVAQPVPAAANREERAKLGKVVFRLH